MVGPTSMKVPPEMQLMWEQFSAQWFKDQAAQEEQKRNEELKAKEREEERKKKRAEFEESERKRREEFERNLENETSEDNKRTESEWNEWKPLNLPSVKSGNDHEFV